MFKLSVSLENQYLFYIIKNNLINTNNKIKLLKTYSDIELNIKNDSGEGILMYAMYNNDNILFDYLLTRNIDIYYYTAFIKNNPVRLGLYIDIINNINNYTLKLLDKIKNISYFL